MIPLDFAIAKKRSAIWSAVTIVFIGLSGVLLAGLCACAKKETLPVAPPQSIKPTPDIPTIQTFYPKNGYTIQIGAFKSFSRAEQFAQKMVGNGVDAYYYKDKSSFVKVRCGKFKKKSAASNYAQSLENRGIIKHFFIVQPGLPKPKPSKKDYRKIMEKKLVNTAKKFIGIPYVWGGTTAEIGFDCSGLTMTVYRMNGLKLPRKAALQYKKGDPVARVALRRGDLVFFATNGDNEISHVGIYSGSNKFIHAPGTGKNIRVSSLTSEYYDKNYRGARRYF